MAYRCCTAAANTVTIYVSILLELGFIIAATLTGEHLFIIPVVVFPVIMVSAFIIAAFVRHRNRNHEEGEFDLEAQTSRTTDGGSVASGGSMESIQGLSVGIDGHGLVVDMDYAKALSHIDSKLIQTISSLHGVRTRFSYQELVEATNSFARKLDDAPYCAVYEGIHRNTGEQIIVKKMDYSKADESEKRFLAELNAASVNHRCMVQLIGFCQEDNHRYLVFEKMANGALDKWIFGSKGSNVRSGTLLDWSKRLSIAIEIAKGLTFLHDWCQGQVVKFDIECRNIFLDEAFHPKFSSFGATLKELSKLQRAQSRKSSSFRSNNFNLLSGNSHQITPALPEHVAPDTIITQKSDVFSYGVVLLELVSGQSSQDAHKPYSAAELHRSSSVARATFAQECFKRFVRFAPGTSPSKPHPDRPDHAEPQDDVVKYSEEDIESSIHGIDHFVDIRLRGNFDEAEATRMVQVALWCIQKDPRMRPTMSMVVHLLEGDFDVNNCLPKGLKGLQTVKLDQSEV